ncbi:dyslexia-associated protein KIAA0319 isoform X2 [Clinocottus analis]|uniref:dyslexia-associated protein KIAA0319 isoform X2 n=1 Tax=Clinocottus analis TaxID=304258 RepID=UPI0035C0448C
MSSSSRNIMPSMWEKVLLLLHSVQAVLTSQCWQGATFSEAVPSPAVENVLRVPGAAALPQCVAAGCSLPGYDLAWLFEGRCYILSCQQKSCRPRQRPGADSSLAFLQRGPQTLLLQSLVRGEPYPSRWRPFMRSSEPPRDLEALKDLALLDGSPQDFSDPGMLDAEYPEGSQEERGGNHQLSLEGREQFNQSEERGGNHHLSVQGREQFNQSEEREGNHQLSVEGREQFNQSEERGGNHQLSVEGREQFNQSEAEDGPEGGPTGSSMTQNRASSGGNIRQGDDKTWRPTASAEKTTETQSTVDSTSRMFSLLPKPTTVSTVHDHIRPSLPSLATPTQPIGPSFQPDVLKVLQSAVEAPPTATYLPDRPLTSDPTATQTPSNNPTTAATADSVSEVRGSTRGPVAIVGPDRKLLLPVSSLSLDGGGSTDDHGIASYRWDAVSGPPGLKLEGADQAIATASGLRVGRYTFRLTVSNQQGATDRASLSVRVQEATSLPPVAHASGSHTVSLPNSSLVLRGSVTDGDQTEVHYLWVRDSQSPAAGDVLYGSGTQASLFLANLVEGTYLFQLRATDAQGRSSTATATVEVRPEAGGGQELELEMLVPVSQVSVAQRDTVVRQLAALIHVLDSDIRVRALQGHSHLSTVLRFSVWGPSGPISGSRLVVLLRNQLLREKSDYLLFRVLRVDTVLCLLHCSGRGQCDPVTKECACDPFWTENLVRRYLGDGESNCEWRVLYVILTSFVLMVFILSVSWTFICCCRRRKQTRVRKKTKYTILNNMDDQERVELRPKFSIKHRSTEHNSSLMMSESELDSDQDTVFSRDRPVRSRNRVSGRNGNAFG